ncbi:hypothetical protein N9L47_00225 [Rhodobacteraceae bacterium]|nr:hypothetical protein [Paracoccaceae bacterium]
MRLSFDFLSFDFRAFGFLALLLLASPAVGDVLTERDAQRALFSEKGHSIRMAAELTELEQKIVTGIIPLMAQQLRQPVRYYAAIAYSPDDGMVHDSIQAAMNYHTPEAASRAAVAACNAMKSNGTQNCKVAAQVVPKRYKSRDLTLSIDATVAFDRTYRKAKSPKAFAISGKSGSWGIGQTDDAARAGCESSGGPGDCEIVIRD